MAMYTAYCTRPLAVYAVVRSGCPNRVTASSSSDFQSRTINNRLGPSVVRQQAVAEVQGDPCVPSPCGPQAQCRSTGNRAVSYRATLQCEQEPSSFTVLFLTPFASLGCMGGGGGVKTLPPPSVPYKICASNKIFKSDS
jgi:hypothetical protein